MPEIKMMMRMRMRMMTMRTMITLPMITIRRRTQHTPFKDGNRETEFEQETKPVE